MITNLDDLECPPEDEKPKKVEKKVGKSVRGIKEAPGKDAQKKRTRWKDQDYGRRNLIKQGQENLTEEQLREEILQCLTSVDPCRAKNLVIWDYTNRTYNDPDQMVTVYHMESEYLFNKSEEIQDYKGELMDAKSDNPQIGKSQTARSIASGQVHPRDGPNQMNLFTCCTRSSQTINQPLRESVTQTEPPIILNYKNGFNQWIIYDAYEGDRENAEKSTKVQRRGLTVAEDDEEGGEKPPPPSATKKRMEEAAALANASQESDKVKFRKASMIDGQGAIDLTLARSAAGLSLAERVVTQNVYADILDDFKYYEDDADNYRESGEGTLLPLWRFAYERAKKMCVTEICWSKICPDMFVASFGSFNFVNMNPIGMVIIGSLRNMSYPEQVWESESGVMSIDIHPENSCLVAAGLNDGNVAFLSLQKNADNKNRTEIFRNAPIKLKHGAPIWTVRWAPNDMDGVPNFISAGMDGKIIQWKVGLRDAENGGGGLEGTEISLLYLPKEPQEGPDGTTFKTFGCARSLAFHPSDKHCFVIGTMEGLIFLGSSLYSSYFPKIYNAHFLPVSAIQWNAFHPDVFLSSSEDWTIKIWDRNSLSPMYTFEIGLAILDACWAPYSSTVFSAVTEEGKALVYDINVNSDKPICSQQVVTKKKFRPHRARFNPVYPIIAVGDDRGQLIFLKLSPNLRIKSDLEKEKLDELLLLVRDPESITNPQDLPGPSGDRLGILSSDEEEEVVVAEREELEKALESKLVSQRESEQHIGDSKVLEKEPSERPSETGITIEEVEGETEPLESVPSSALASSHTSHTTTPKVIEVDSIADEGSEIGGEDSISGMDLTSGSYLSSATTLNEIESTTTDGDRDSSSTFSHLESKDQEELSNRKSKKRSKRAKKSKKEKSEAEEKPEAEATENKDGKSTAKSDTKSTKSDKKSKKSAKSDEGSTKSKRSSASSKKDEDKKGK